MVLHGFLWLEVAGCTGWCLVITMNLIITYQCKHACNVQTARRSGPLSNSIWSAVVQSSYGLDSRALTPW